MKLSVLERFTALQLLPKEGDYITLGVIRKTQEKLSFTEDEIAKYKFKQNGEQTTWDNQVEQVTDIRIGNKVISLIAEELEKLNKDKKLTPQHMTLYDKFVEKQK